ncbi:LOB domain-containing protein 6-like [Cocos nucifera]|nr:LOB domain-containing protein 6-like [Cocos nucifera]
MSCISTASSTNSSARRVLHHAPCALCRQLEQICRRDCPFADHFPANEPRRLRYVSRVYGAHNVARMLQELPRDQRRMAANSMIYDAALRIRDPVRGAAGVISGLQRQLMNLRAEIESLRSQLAQLPPAEAAADGEAPQQEEEGSGPPAGGDHPGEPSSPQANKRPRVAPSQ